MTPDIREQLQTTLGAAYTLERELGGGGMSRVFVADETRLRRKVVVKVLSPELAQGLSADRFEREIQLAASLQQANIVPVLNAGETAGFPFYTMPYVEGESLRLRLRTRGALPIGEAVSVLRDVARALAYAHERGIVHRDIKPDNVLLSGGTAVVTDFGIAKAIAASRTQSGEGATLTQLGTSIGTPAYISPEQAAGDPDVDHRADIYSFGCMAYELLAGQPPFVNRTPQRLMAAHMNERPQPIAELRPDTPPALASMVMRCLEKDAAARPQNASELFGALESALTSDTAQPAMPAILMGGRGMLKKALAAYVVAFVFVAILAKAAIVGIGLPDWVFPGSLIVMALGLPAILFTGYTQYVARRAIMVTSPTFTPGGSPSTAAHGTMANIAIKASPHLSWRRTALGGIYAVAAFVLLIGGFMLLRAMGIGPAGSLLANGTLSQNERILVADFQSRTSDTTLGPVVTEAFRTSLGQSDRITVMPQTAIRDVLTRMQRPLTSKIDFALAREIATREGLKAVVDGSILNAGTSYEVSAKLVSVQSGEQLASFTERAADANGILPAIDQLSKHMRARIGESLRKVQSAPILEQVSTPSLEALKKYVQGSQELQAGGDFNKGVALLEDAIALDTGFAMAYRKLGIELGNRGGQAARVMELIQKAYDHRDRLSDAERYLTLADYYQNGPHADHAKAIAAYEALIAVQPDNPAALNNVANLYRDLHDFAKADEFYKRAMKTGVIGAVFFTNRLITTVSLKRFDEAHEVLRQFAAAAPNHVSFPGAQARMALLDGKIDSATAVLQAALDRPSADAASKGAWAATMADIVTMRGHLADGLRWRAAQRQAGRQRRVAAAALGGALDSAEVDLWFREDRARGVRELDAALQAHPLDSIPAVERPFNRLVTLYSLAGRPDRARELAADFERTRRNLNLLSDTVVRPDLLGALAMADNKYADAAREYRIADGVNPCTICELPQLARAYDLGGNADSAIAVFTRYVETPYIVRSGPDGIYLAGAHKRLGELFEAKGDKRQAAAHYAKFIELWKTADPELQPKVAEVQRRLSRLTDTESHKP